MKPFFCSIIFFGLLSSASIQSQAAQQAGFAGPREVLREYLRRDYNGDFTSSKGWKDIQRLAVWERAPDWDETVVVRSQRVLSARAGKDRAVIKVQYDSLGSLLDSAEGYVLRRTANSRSIVHFELALTHGVWKIVAPQLPPHVSLSFALKKYTATPSVCQPPKKCRSRQTIEDLKRMAK